MKQHTHIDTWIPEFTPEHVVENQLLDFEDLYFFEYTCEYINKNFACLDDFCHPIIHTPVDLSEVVFY